MQNFKFGALTSEASLLSNPQDKLKNCETDFTSIFGNKQNVFLKELPLKRDVENNATPFSYNAMVTNVFGDLSDKDIPTGSLGRLNSAPLEFEC